MDYTLKLKTISPVTHDTYSLTFARPEGYEFTPGQATDLALDREGWRTEKRPFTFVSDPGGDELGFVIKSYEERDGVTAQIPTLKPGNTVIIGPAWGAIEDKGPGVFIAGGAGITPFLGILRDRVRRGGDWQGSTLIFSNKCEKDIILRQELQSMPGLNCIFTLTDEDITSLPHAKVDADFLDEVVKNFDQVFYLCGPKPMVSDLGEVLKSRGVTKDNLIVEES
jgi:ferredoxin-NADP reductase